MSKEITILGVSGGIRKNGVTGKAVEHFLETAASIPGVKTEMIDLAGKDIRPCLGCNACYRKKAECCPVIQDDFDPAWMEMYRHCNALVIASPIYQMNPAGAIVNFMGRLRPAGPSGRCGKYEMRLGTSIAVGGRRNGGQDTTVNALNNQLQTFGVSVIGGGVMFYNGPAVWSAGSRELEDATGRQEIEVAGRKLACLTRAMYAGVEALRDEIPLLGYAGFETPEQQAQAYAFLGL